MRNSSTAGQDPSTGCGVGHNLKRGARVTLARVVGEHNEGVQIVYCMNLDTFFVDSSRIVDFDFIERTWVFLPDASDASVPSDVGC